MDRRSFLAWCRRMSNGAKLDDRRKDSAPVPYPEHCVGCGLCVEVCPLRYKAISVKPPFPPDRGTVRAE